MLPCGLVTYQVTEHRPVNDMNSSIRRKVYVILRKEEGRYVEVKAAKRRSSGRRSS
jgi:hypothetical protein